MTRPTWNEWYLAHAELAAKRSKDSTQVGAALIGLDGEVRMTAYNGPPRGVEDLPERRERPAKYLFAAHAEANLIAFAARAGIPTSGCLVYVTHHPCADCAKLLIQAGVRTVLYGDGATSMPPESRAAAEAMFAEAGVWAAPASEGRE